MRADISNAIADCISDLINERAYSVTKILSPRVSVKATYQLKPLAHRTRTEIRVTFGALDAKAREKLKSVRKAVTGDIFPLKTIRYSFPVKGGKRRKRT